jgi:hypothetical protein
VQIDRAQGPVVEPRVEVVGRGALGVEWEWENSPEAGSEET